MIPTYSLEDLNEFVFPRILRTYQQCIVENKVFKILLEDKCYLFTGVKCHKGKNVLFFQNDDYYLSLTSSGIGKAYALNKSDISYIKSIPKFNKNKVIVRTGHANFAHFIWNQLPALLKISSSVYNINYYQEINSIIDIKELGFKCVSELDDSVWNLYVGSLQVSRECRDLLLKELSNSIPPKMPLSQNVQNIYIGVRGPGLRELTNEVDFYVKLIKSIYKRHGDKVRFIIDGFSFQNNNIENDAAIKRSNKINCIIEEIQKKVESQLVNINGLLLSEFVKHIKYINFYITHEGTMQHKIGWLYPDKHGVILSGSQTPELLVKWHCNQVENNSTLRTLSALPLGVITQNDTLTTLRNNTFEITDEKKAIDFLLSAIEQKVLI